MTRRKMADKPALLDPRDYERAYDEHTGDMGRGMRHLTPEQFDLAGYAPYISPGTTQSTFPCYDKGGLPDGWAWRGWIKDDKVIAFESLMRRRRLPTPKGTRLPPLWITIPDRSAQDFQDELARFSAAVKCNAGRRAGGRINIGKHMLMTAGSGEYAFPVYVSAGHPVHAVAVLMASTKSLIRCVLEFHPSDRNKCRLARVSEAA